MANIQVQHAKSVTVADWSGTVTVANSTGGSTTAAASDLARPSDWNSSHNITFGLSAADIAPLITVSGELSVSTDTNKVTIYKDAKYQSGFEPFILYNTNSTLSAPGNGTWYLDPFQVNQNITKGVFQFPAVQGASSQIFQNGAVFTTNSTGSVSRFATISNKFAIYTQGSGANYTRLESYATFEANVIASQEMRVTTDTNSAITVSHYAALTIPALWDSTGGVSTSAFTTSGTVTSTTTTTIAAPIGSGLLTTGCAAFISGSVMNVAGFTTTLAPGNYWLGHMQSSTSSTTGTNYGAGTVLSTQSVLGLLENNMVNFKQIGKSVSNSSTAPIPWHGYFATTSAAAPASIATSAIRATTGRMYWNVEVETNA